jgi:hypothetical protein
MHLVKGSVAPVDYVRLHGSRSTKALLIAFISFVIAATRQRTSQLSKAGMNGCNSQASEMLVYR